MNKKLQQALRYVKVTKWVFRHPKEALEVLEKHIEAKEISAIFHNIEVQIVKKIDWN